MRSLTCRRKADWVNTGSYVIISGDAGDVLDMTTRKDAHIILSNINEPIDANSTIGVRFSYVNCGSTDHGIRLNDATQVEIDHIYLNKNAASSDDFAISSVNVAGAAYDVNKYHHNHIRVIRSSCGEGDDGIQGVGGGVSVYNNWLISYSGTYTGGQHGDGIQPLSANFLKIYNNYFADWPNYAVFCDAYVGDFTHVRIYNNIAAITDSGLNSCDAIKGIVAGPDGGAFSNLGRWPAFTDFVMVNNIAVDFTTHDSFVLENNPGQSSVFSQCAFQNNIIINSGGAGIDGSVTNNHNVTFTSAQAPSHFVSYATDSAANDYHIINSSESSLKDAGVTLSAYFSTDAEGNTRPQGSAWDIGPYEFVVGGGGDTTPPTVSSATINSAGTQITLAMSETIAFGANGNGGLTLSMSGGAVTATFSSGAGTSSLVYSLSRKVLQGETGTHSYTQPGSPAGNGIEDTAGNDLVNYSGATVTNNSTAAVGSVQFSSATYSVNENVSTVTITATRTGGSANAGSVNYATSNGTATSGSDYTSTSGTLNWTDGDSANKTFSVTILDDLLVEGNETVNLTLSSPSVVSLGSQSTAVMTIVENDTAPVSSTVVKNLDVNGSITITFH
jgi:hypothetical protein